jgi:hypothetical protein
MTSAAAGNTRLGELYPHVNEEISQIYIQTAVPNAPKHTGYIPNASDPETKTTQAFRLFDTHHEDPKLAYGALFKQQATIRVHTPNALNQAFFSEENMEYLQQEIRYRVWEKSGGKHVIDRQRADDLKTIMRAYYLQFSRNVPGKEREEIHDLDERVLDFCVGDILGSINMYIYNQRELLDFPEPIGRPINAHVMGTKSKEFKSFF